MSKMKHHVSVTNVNYLPPLEDIFSPQIFPLDEDEESSESTARDKNTAGTQPSLPWYLRSVKLDYSY